VLDWHPIRPRLLDDLDEHRHVAAAPLAVRVTALAARVSPGRGRSSPAGRDTAAVARTQRRVERVVFSATDAAPVLASMARLADAGDGWINVVPRIAGDEERPTTLGFLTMLSGGGPALTMCTWTPGKRDEARPGAARLGITHVTGRRAVGTLHSLAIPLPRDWAVEQDHPRRGLVVRLPAGVAHDQVLAWALRAVAALSDGRAIKGWSADVYLPTAP
jgi:hypothetical protein